jgi:hypothetical protein
MRKAVRLIGLTIALAVLGTWFFCGHNLGWTKTSRTHKYTDPVTGIQVDRYEDAFIPGVDFLGAGLIASVVVLGISFVLRHKPQPA